ncbi:MAG: DUF4249 family protein [Paludibacteraceae bacterium]|nr:DUF4249 family protein [Paludibacteraceae bacterium]
MKRILFYILGLILLCTSCEREITYTGEITNPKLVMQAEVGEGDTIIKAYVSRSRFFLDDPVYYGNTDYTMPEALTEMKRGEQEWKAMSWSAEKKAFVIELDSALQAGETIQLRASHPKYEPITASQTVVRKPWLQVWEFNGMKGTLWRNKFRKRIEVGLILQNYYPIDGSVLLGVSAECKYTVIFQNGKRTERYSATTTRILSSDELFATVENPYTASEGFNSRFELFFAPGYQNATSVTIEIPYDYYAPQGGEEQSVTIQELKIRFNAHNRDSYLYWQSMYKMFGEDTSDEYDLGAALDDMVGTEENVQIYSNIEGGYGIFAACSRYEVLWKDIKTVTE